MQELDDDEPLQRIIKTAREQNIGIIPYYDELIEKYTSIDEIREEFISDIKKNINEKWENGRSRYVTHKLINPNLEVPTI